MSAAARGSRLVVSVCGVVVGLIVGGAFASACGLSANLAQIEFFASLRPELIDDCCTCLAEAQTTDNSATCAEAFVLDGEVRTPADAVFASEEAPIPCLCGGDKASCAVALERGGDILVPGSCIDSVELVAPCESECAGVLTFDPLPQQ